MNKPFIIGISGGSGSGKTSFVKNLRNDFSEKSLCILSQDDYYKPREEQFVDENGFRNFDLLESIDHKSFELDIQEILNGNSIKKKEYVFNNPLAEPKYFTVNPAKVVIVEGLFVFHFDNLVDLIDLRVFIHADEEKKLARRIKRDAEERNYPLEDVTYRYHNHVLPSYRKYIEPHKDHAHVVINNNDNYDKGYKVLSKFIDSRIEE